MKKFDNLKESIEANIQIDNFFSFRNLLNVDKDNYMTEQDSLIGLVNEINVTDRNKKMTNLEILMAVNNEMDSLKDSLNKTFANLNISISRNKSINESNIVFNQTSRFNRTTDNICNIFDNDIQNELNSIRKIQNNENKQKYEVFNRSQTSLSNKLQPERQLIKQIKKEDAKQNDTTSLNYKQQMEKYKEFLKSQESNKYIK
jgi:hypothetical protein